MSPKLALPLEGARRLHLGRYELGDHVSGVYVYGTDGHDLLTVPDRQVSQQQHDQRVQLGYLFLLIIF